MQPLMHALCHGHRRGFIETNCTPHFECNDSTCKILLTFELNHRIDIRRIASNI